MAVKNGKPATSFNAQNRKWVRDVAGESGGGGGSGLPAVTEADNGKILGVVNGAWGAMDAGGGGSSDFSTAEVTVTVNGANPITIYVPCTLYDEMSGVYTADNNIYCDPADAVTREVILYKDLAWGMLPSGQDYTVSVTGSITYDMGYFEISGDGTITITESEP